MLESIKHAVRRTFKSKKESTLQEWEKKIATKVNPPFKAVLPHLQDDSVVIDIGANVGAFSDKVLEKFKAAEIHLFEPVPKYYNRLQEKYYGVRNVKINTVACSDEKGSFNIWVDKYNLGWNTMIETKAEPGMVSIEIEAVQFDGYAKANAIDHIDVIKIDVEGAEYKVLRGMKETLTSLQKKPVILCEIGWGKDGHPNWKEETEVFEWLFSIGYQRFEYEKIKSTTDVLFLPS